jgi:GTP-binding protein
MPLTVAVVGRPNVGKSTLFNRLIGRRLAIVDDTPGVTRDRREAVLALGDGVLTLVDTAGFEDAAASELAERVQAQTRLAIAAADLVLLVIDARAGITPLDSELAALVRRAGVPVILVANKYDGGAGHAGALEAFGLGIGEPLLVSANQGEGMGYLTDALRAAVRAHADAEGTAIAAAGPPAIQLAVVGRPNVGKSTLVNRLIGQQRLITGPEAGITRDAIAVDWAFHGHRLRLIDTAGLRRRARVDDHIEAFAAAESLRTIRTAQVCVVVIDAVLGLDKQDLAIARMVADEGRCPVLALNKWDLIEAPQQALAAIDRRIEASLAQVRGLSRVPVSALTGRGLDRLIGAVIAAHDAWSQHVATGPLNRWLHDAIGRHAPPAVQGRPFKLRYITQVGTRPPRFALFANREAALAEGYLRYLANGLRARFGFAGVPLRFQVRASRNPYAP